MVFTGFHNISTMTMSFRVECAPNYYDPNCTTLCLDSSDGDNKCEFLSAPLLRVMDPVGLCVEWLVLFVLTLVAFLSAVGVILMLCIRLKSAVSATNTASKETSGKLIIKCMQAPLEWVLYKYI